MLLRKQPHPAVEPFERERKHAIAHQLARDADRVVIIPNRLGLRIQPDRVVIDIQKPLRISGAMKIAAGLTSMEEVMSVAPPVVERRQR